MSMNTQIKFSWTNNFETWAWSWTWTWNV